MGNSPGKQALDDFSTKIRRGDAAGVGSFLQRISAARQTSGAGVDKLVQELKTLDLNAPVLESSYTPLQLAASCGRAEIVRFLIDTCSQDPHLPKIDPNALDSRRRTALHFAAAFVGPPHCSQCVADLLSRKADPCIADVACCTPLQVARQFRCPHCVRTLEDTVKLWQGWADHDEHQFLQLPNWRPRWLVACKDRYPNTGPSRYASSVTVSCYSCRTVLQAPPYSFRITCGCCGAQVAVTTSIQVAIYEPRPQMTNMVLPDTPTPIVVIPLPMNASQIAARPLEEAGLKSFAGALFEGKIRRALQNTSGSTRTFGFTMKIMGYDGSVQCEHSLRVATDADRTQLLQILQDPAKASYEAALAQALPTKQAAPVVAVATPITDAPAASSSCTGTPMMGGLVEPWNCSQCTYEHSGIQACLTTCAICDTPRYTSAAAQALPTAIPQPSAPPLHLEPSAPSLEASGPAHSPPTAQPKGMPSGPPSAQATIHGPSPAFHATAPPPSNSTVVAGVKGGQDIEDGMCAVCMERPADTAVVPCGHMCGCFSCLQGIRGTANAQCPMCRGPLTSTIRIYRN